MGISNKKVQRLVYVDPVRMELLSRLSKKTRRPIASYVREGVDEVIEKYYPNPAKKRVN